MSFKMPLSVPDDLLAALTSENTYSSFVHLEVEAWYVDVGVQTHEGDRTHNCFLFSVYEHAYFFIFYWLGFVCSCAP